MRYTSLLLVFTILFSQSPVYHSVTLIEKERMKQAPLLVQYREASLDYTHLIENNLSDLRESLHTLLQNEPSRNKAMLDLLDQD